MGIYEIPTIQFPGLNPYSNGTMYLIVLKT